NRPRVHDFHRVPGSLSGGLRTLARAGRPTQGGRRGRLLLGWRVPDLRHRRLHPPALASLSRQRGEWWMRTRPGIHLTSIHLIKWFPDRRGMATRLAIMGFGGG